MEVRIVKIIHFEQIKQYLKLLYKTYQTFFKAAFKITLLLVLLTPIQALLPLVTVQAGQKLVDQLTAQKSYVYFLILWIIATLLTQLLPVLVTNIQGILTDKLTGFINISLMEKSKKLMTLELFDNSAYFDDLKLLSEDASWRPVNLIVFGVAVLRDALTLVGMFCLLGKYNCFLALLLFLVLLPQTLVYYRIQQEAFETMVTRSKNARKLDYFSSLLLERKDAKEVRIFQMFNSVIKKYRTLFFETQRTVNAVRKKQLVIASCFLLLTVTVSSLGFWWFIVQVQRQVLGVGILLLYISVIASIIESMTNIVETTSLLYDSLLWVKKYEHFLDFKESATDGKLEFDADFEALIVKDLSFTYPFSTKEVLHQINFSVKKGERIAIVGENGSGKSTLVKLLLKLYPASSGTISFDEQKLRDLSAKSYWQKVTVAFQDFSHFKLSLQDNVTALEELPEATVKALLQEVTLPLKAPLKLTTILSREFEGGTELSGGQWQKVALARCLHRKSKLIFLDEPTAALDAKSEQELYRHFVELGKDTTLLFVTHRMSAVNLADKVLFLKDGRSVACGPHKELLATEPSYRELYELQKQAYR